MKILNGTYFYCRRAFWLISDCWFSKDRDHAICSVARKHKGKRVVFDTPEGKVLIQWGDS